MISTLTICTHQHASHTHKLCIGHSDEDLYHNIHRHSSYMYQGGSCREGISHDSHCEGVWGIRHSQPSSICSGSVLYSQRRSGQRRTIYDRARLIIIQFSRCIRTEPLSNPSRMCGMEISSFVDGIALFGDCHSEVTLDEIRTIAWWCCFVR